MHAELCDDERTARVMTDIANSVMPGIVMEFDLPSRNLNNKMAVLDMEVSDLKMATLRSG